MRVRALLIDLDGVVYEGDTPVPGAAEAIAWLEANSLPHLFLTNTTSRSREALVDKLAGMGISIDAADILTPPVAAVDWVAANVEGGVELFVPEATHVEFEALARAKPGEVPGALVVGDYGESWSFAELNRAFRLLMSEPPPKLVALGMTRYWQATDGLRLDTGPFVTALAYASGVDPAVLGKPAAPFFETALSSLGVAASDTLMIGDDIRVDVGGAQACGIRGALVRTGKFRAPDLAVGIEPDVVLDSIADLPDWWQA